MSSLSIFLQHLEAVTPVSSGFRITVEEVVLGLEEVCLPRLVAPGSSACLWCSLVLRVYLSVTSCSWAALMGFCLANSERWLAVLSSDPTGLLKPPRIPGGHSLALRTSYSLVGISLLLFCLHSGYVLGSHFWFTNELCLIIP